jgi:glycosyltransferase involved in cell wall biosynthesis
MRVLHLDSGKEMRGGQWQVLRLIEGLTGAGVESTLLARRGAPLFEAASRKGWRVEPLGISRAIALAGKHDLIHAHDARSHTLGAVARSTPLLVSRRVAFPIRSRWKYGRVRMFLAVSEFVKSVLREGGVPDEKIAVVYDGVPLLETRWGTAILALDNAADREKGAGLAVEAARLSAVPLRLTTDLERDLAHAGLFVYITHSEGLGSAALLAMSAGVPVIASKIGGLPEIIRHGENGLLVDNSLDAIAAAIHNVLERPDFAACLGQAARRTVEQKFTAAHMVRRTMEVYGQVLA